MKQLRPFVYALLASATIIALMFVFQSIMQRKANMWADMEMVIPLYDRILLEIAELWGRFWILFVPFIIGAPLFAAFFVTLYRAK
jgi:Na+/serine symporter